MDDAILNKYCNKRSYNNLPVEEGMYLVPFLVHNWEEVKAMNYCRDNLENWHFNGIRVLVAFAPVSAEKFSSLLQLFWKDVRDHIAEMGGNTDVLSYDKMIDDLVAEDNNGYDPAQSESLEDTALLRLMIEELIQEVERLNPRYGRILRLIEADNSRSEILTIILDEYGLKKTQGYSEIKAAQKFAHDIYLSK